MTSPQTRFPPDQHVAGYAPTYSDGVTPTNGNGYELDGRTPVTPFVGGGQRSGGVVVYFDGRPASRHTYGGTVWLPTQQRVLLISGSMWAVGNYDPYCGWFDPTTGIWTRKTNLPHGYAGIASAYDKVRDRVIWSVAGTQTVYSYDSTTDIHTRIGTAARDPLGAGTGPFTTFCCDGACEYVYAVNKDGWGSAKPAAYTNVIVRMALGQTAVQEWQPIQVIGDTTGMYGMNPGFEYDPDKNAFVFWAKEDPGNVSILRLADFRIHRVSIKGAAPASTQLAETRTGVWGRFRRYDTHKYCLMVSASSPIFLITLA